MKAWETYAIIKPDGYIGNVLSYLVGTGGYTLANVEAFRAYGSGAVAVEISYFRVGIGDLYKNNKFYKMVEGELEEVIEEEHEEETIARIDSAQEDTDNAMLDHEERLILLEAGV